MATTTPSKISAEQFLTHFMQLDDLQWKTESIFLGMAKDTTTLENYSSWLKSYDVTLRSFKDLSKQNITSDADTQKRMEHFKKKLSSVEGSLSRLTINNFLFKPYLPPNYIYTPNNPQFLHRDTVNDTVEPSASAAAPGSTMKPPAQAPSSPLSPIPGLEAILQQQRSSSNNPFGTGSSSFPLPTPFTPPGSVPENVTANRARNQSPLGSPMVNLPTLSSTPTTSNTTLQPLSQRQVQQWSPPISTSGSPSTIPPFFMPPSVVFTPTPGTPSAFAMFPPGHPLNPQMDSPPASSNPSYTYSTQFSSSTSAMRPMDLTKSFSISKFDKNASMNQEIPDRVLGHISYLLRNGKESEALELFNKLPNYEKTEVYGVLWALRGKPMPGSPIHHENFGEVSFLNQEERCKSTPMQKACAIEIFRAKSDITRTIIHTLSKMSLIMEKGDTVEYKKLFNGLPREIQNAIKARHWEVCDRPMPGNPIAHDNFGEVSFLATERRCDVPHSKRIETVKAVRDSMLSESLYSTYKAIGSDIPAKIQEWEGIDAAKGRGENKNNAKKETLHALAKQMVPLFLPEEAAVPAVNHDSYKGLAAAYVEKYPLLKGCFLLLIPDLRINEAIEMDANTPKRTQANPPNFSGMEHNAKENYRRSLNKGYIDETLHTLKAGYYVTDKGEMVTFNLLPAIDSLSSHRKDQYNAKKLITHETKIFLYSKDCLTVAQDCVERGLNPIVLNAANNELPGGGYKTGAAGQEESLMRRTGLPDVIDTDRSKNFYPINKEAPHTGLYVSNVPVFRGEEAQGCPYLEKPFETAFAIMPAFNFNKEFLIKNGIQNPPELEKNAQGQLQLPKPFSKQSTNKLGTVFDIAESNGHDAIVLVAWGSGAFHNPPEQICELMIDMLVHNYPFSFKEVHLCIVDDQNTGQPHNPKGNYAAYKETINTKYSNAIKNIQGMSFQAL